MTNCLLSFRNTMVKQEARAVSNVVFVVEATANVGAYFDSLKSVYILPTLEWVYELSGLFEVLKILFHFQFKTSVVYFDQMHLYRAWMYWLCFMFCWWWNEYCNDNICILLLGCTMARDWLGLLLLWLFWNPAWAIYIGLLTFSGTSKSMIGTQEQLLSCDCSMERWS